ncbi:MAG TPA: hypothetical protein VGF45_07035 [Polyangia bacterium]
MARYLFNFAVVVTTLAGLEFVEPFDESTTWAERGLGAIVTAALLFAIVHVHKRVSARGGRDPSSGDARVAIGIGAALAVAAAVLCFAAILWRDRYDRQAQLGEQAGDQVGDRLAYSITAGRREFLRLRPPGGAPSALSGVFVEWWVPPERGFVGATCDGRKTFFWVETDRKIEQRPTSERSKAAEALCAEAGKTIKSAQPLRELPFRNPPFASRDHVRVYWMSDDGLRTTERPMSGVQPADASFAPVFAASTRLLETLASSGALIMK